MTYFSFWDTEIDDIGKLVNRCIRRDFSYDLVHDTVIRGTSRAARRGAVWAVPFLMGATYHVSLLKSLTVG